MSTLALIILFLCAVVSKAIHEPNSCNKFEYVVQTLEKVIKVEFAVTMFEEKLRQFEKSIEASMNRFNEMDAGRLEQMSRLQREIENRTDTIEIKLDETEKGLDNRMNAIETKLEESHNAFASRLSGDVMKMIGEINSTVVQSTKEHGKNKGQQVAFTAHGATGKTVNTVLTFTHVYLNAGDGYDQTTGRFTCPVAGTYLFSATLLSVSSRSAGTFCWIRKNATNVALVYSQEGRHDSASVSVLFHLSVGDVVDLGGCNSVNYIHTSTGHSSFIGSLIQAD